jgi:hypothetical protein
MRFRLKFFAVHISVGFCVLSLVLGALYVGWYRWPAWYLMGAETVALLVLVVDLGVGPLATLVVANPAKPRRELLRDISLIALVQLVALGYGSGALWKGRPLYFVFSHDRAEVVTAAQFDDEVIEAARRQQAPIIPDWTTRLQWVWAPLPSDPELRATIVRSAVAGGHDVTSMPQYFRPLREGAAAMREQYVSPQSLVRQHRLSEEDYHARLAKLGQTESELGVLLLEGRTRAGSMIFDRASGEPLAFWPIKVDLAAARKSK